MTTTIVKETTGKVTKTIRPLNMHPLMLLDIIGRQAGTFDKAGLEGVMNSIEAIIALKADGGTCSDEAIHITHIKEDGKALFGISDRGKGITSRQEIEDFFETFGTPHTESEHKVYAQFRMGRGQMFNFGRNIWRTGTFRMTVDIAKMGLSYELEEGLPYYEGCDIQIELYDKYLDTWPVYTVDCLKEAIKKQVAFVDYPIMFNDKQISTPPTELNWDYEDEYAYYAFNVGDALKIYNLGVYVQDRHQTTGIIVSKQQLLVNFPRNDVMADCPIYNKIDKVIKKNIVKKSKKKYVSLSQNERRSILKDLRNGVQEYRDVKGARVLQTAQDKYISFNMFLKNNQPWTIGRIGDRLADKVIQKGSHICFAEEMMEAMDYTEEPKNFFSWIIKTLVENNECFEKHRTYNDYDLHWAKDKIQAKENFYQDFEEATSNMDTSCMTLAHNKYTKVEKRVIDILQDYCCWDDRIICIGVGMAACWTDGHSSINMERHWLKNLRLNTDAGVMQMFTSLTHEMAHDNDTSKTDIHGEDFYKNFHSLCLKGWGSPLSHALDFKKKIEDTIIAERHADKKRKREEREKEVADKLGTAVVAA